MALIEDLYQLDSCLDWILENNFKRIVIQLKIQDLKHSAYITSYLEKEADERLKQTSSINIYVTRSSTCCVDLLVTQHVSELEAVIHFGKVCLSKPQIKNQSSDPPLLIAFGQDPIALENRDQNINLILQEIKNIRESDAYSRICILYDTSLIDHANILEERIEEEGYEKFVEIANLHCPSPTWDTTPEYKSRFIKDHAKGGSLFGHFHLQNSIDYYNCAIYLGDQLSIQLALAGPSKLLKLNTYVSSDIERINTSKLLSKRMALVERIKDEENLKIGVIITNPLPDIGSAMKRLEAYSKPRRHTLYFISMIQTIDECKIGNFDLCDAFIVINSCTCSTILESLVFNRPIITELEYKLACGHEAEYGRVIWPGTSTHLSLDDMINKRKVSDVSVSLIHTRNELLERCSQARANKWSGLEFKASDGESGDRHESLVLEEGLTGIASSYLSEPLKKGNPVAKDEASDIIAHGNDSVCNE